MQKKTFLLVAAACISCVAHKAPAYHVRKAFSFYGGLQGGATTHINTFAEKNSSSNCKHNNSSYTIGGMAGNIGGFAAFNYTFQNLFFSGLVLEGLYCFFNQKNNIATIPSFENNRSINAQTKGMFGGDIVFGKILKAGLSVFASAGPRFTQFVYGQQITGANFSQWHKEEAKMLPGINVSVGFDIPLDEHVGLGLSLSHQRYKSIDLNISGHTPAQSIQSTIRPVINQAMLRLRFS